MKLHYDRDWYPVKHRFKGEYINPSQVGACFSKTDWKNDKVFRPHYLDHLTTIYPSDDEVHVEKNYYLTDDLEIINTRIPVEEKKYCIRDYYANVVNMFDAHMTSLIDQYPGKYTVLSSGGIDSHMVAAWMYKNKLDFTVIGLVNAPRHNQKNTDIVNKSIESWKKLVPAKIMYLEKDLLVNDYINCDNLASVPKPPQNHLDGYDYRTINNIKDDCDWILHGGGSNHTMLHNGKQILPAYNSLDTKWKLFKNTSVMELANYPDLCETTYNSQLTPQTIFDSEIYANLNWNEEKIRWDDHGCWISYSRLYESSDDRILNLVNENWYNLWESIDWRRLDLKLVKELLNAEVWRTYLKKYTNDDIESVTSTINSSTSLYTPNEENKKICERLCLELMNRFKGNLPMMREISACQWLLQRYDKVNAWGLALCHMENWLQKH